jgi:hypothetical protein
MNERKLKQLWAAARTEPAPVPPASFAAEVLRAARGLARGREPQSVSLFDQLNRLFPRLATISAVIILLCVAGDIICTLTGLPDVGEGTAQLAADNLLDTEDL